jgi:adenine-specific DNA-methyltransferase
LRDRLTVARDLLADSGSIFVQIGQENCHLARGLLDEVFGADNFTSQIVFAKTAGATSETCPDLRKIIFGVTQGLPASPLKSDM